MVLEHQPTFYQGLRVLLADIFDETGSRDEAVAEPKAEEKREDKAPVMDLPWDWYKPCCTEPTPALHVPWSPAYYLITCNHRPAYSNCQATPSQFPCT